MPQTKECLLQGYITHGTRWHIPYLYVIWLLYCNQGKTKNTFNLFFLKFMCKLVIKYAILSFKLKFWNIRWYFRWCQSNDLGLDVMEAFCVRMMVLKYLKVWTFLFNTLAMGWGYAGVNWKAIYVPDLSHGIRNEVNDKRQKYEIFKK